MRSAFVESPDSMPDPAARESERSLGSQFPRGLVSALAVIAAASTVYGNTRLMHSARTTFCGTCRGSIRSELVGNGWFDGVFFGCLLLFAWATARSELRAVVACALTAIIGWWVATEEAFPRLPR